MTQEITDRLLKNYHNARKSWEGWCYLNNIDLKTKKPEIRSYADENELLYYTRYLFLKDIYIELYKIIKKSNSSKDNIFKLLENHNTEESKLHLEKLNDFENELKYLTNTRDKFYAHLDPNYAEIVKGFKIKDYYKTFELIEQAIFILGKENQLLELLSTIPSRDEFDLHLK